MRDKNGLHRSTNIIGYFSIVCTLVLILYLVGLVVFH